MPTDLCAQQIKKSHYNLIVNETDKNPVPLIASTCLSIADLELKKATSINKCMKLVDVVVVWGSNLS
jgi:hypothetical protein